MKFTLAKSTACWALCVALVFCCFNSQSKVIPIDKLFATPDYDSFKISTDGKFIAGQSFYNNNHSIEVLETWSNSSQEIFRLRGNALSNIMDYSWLNQNSLLINYTNQTGSTFFDIVTIDVTTKKLKDKVQLGISGELLAVDVENKFIVLKEKVFSSDKYKLVKFEIADLINSNTDKKEYIDNEVTADNFWLNDDNQPYIKADLDENKIEFSIKTDSKWQKLISIPYGEAFIPITKLDDRTLAVLSNVETDKVALAHFDLDTKNFGEVLFEHEFYDLYYASFSNTDKDLVSVSYEEGGIPRTQYFEDDSDQYKFLDTSIFKDKISLLIDENLDSKDLIIKTIDSDDSGFFYLANTKTNKVMGLTPAFIALEKYQMSKTQSFSFKNNDQQLVEAFFTPPVHSKKSYPLIVMPHGGPIGVRDSTTYDPEVQFYASRGYAVLKVNFSGSSGYGKTFRNAGVAQFGRKIETDIDLALKKALEIYSIDESKICIVGSSYGGYSAFISAMQSPDTYACVVSSFGVFDIELIFNQSNFEQRSDIQQKISNTLGNIESQETEVFENSPVFHTKNFKIPSLIMAGYLDGVADIEHSNRMAYLLHKHNSPVEFITYINEEHGFDNPYAFKNHLIVIDSFLRDILKGQSSIPKQVIEEIERAKLFLYPRNVVQKFDITLDRLEEMTKQQASF